MEISDHAYQRAKERCGWNKQALERMAEKVMKEGIGHNEIGGSVKRYVDKIYLSHRNASAIKIYGHYIFIFISGSLATVYKMPNKYVNTKGIK